MNADFEDFEKRDSTAQDGGSYHTYGWEPRWDDFSLDDEKRARARFSRFFLSAFLYLIIATVLYAAFTIVLPLVIGASQADALLSSPYFAMTANAVFMYALSLPVFLLLTKNMRPVVRTKRGMSLKDFLILFLIGEACMMIGSLIGTYISAFISAIFGGIDINDGVSELVMSTPMWLVILVAVVIGPIVEELMFRKILMDKLGMYGDRLVIFVSGISFGIFHGDINQIFYATLLGILLAYIYSRTGNVWHCIALHSLLNFLGSVIPMLLYDSSERFYELYELMMAGETVDEAELLRLSAIVGGYSLVVYGMVIAGAVIFFRMRKRFFVSDRCEVLIPKRRLFSVIILNAGAILFLALCTLNVITNIFAPLLTAAAGGA